MLIRQPAGLNRIDMLIHVSVHDLQRNLRRYANREDSTLDRFAPGWRDRGTGEVVLVTFGLHSTDESKCHAAGASRRAVPTFASCARR
jgi:hypothetical protein